MLLHRRSIPFVFENCSLETELLPVDDTMWVPGNGAEGPITLLQPGVRMFAVVTAVNRLVKPSLVYAVRARQFNRRPEAVVDVLLWHIMKSGSFSGRHRFAAEVVSV